VFQMFFPHFLHLSFSSESAGKDEKGKKEKKALGVARNMNNPFSDSKYFIETQKMVMHRKVIAL